MSIAKAPDTKTKPGIERNRGLDWLRGLMAVSIMVYHLQKFLFGDPGSQSLIGRLGIYGVSIFFILSGLSMAMVYSRSIYSPGASKNYFIRRIFRIVPLMCLAVLLQIIVTLLNVKVWPIKSSGVLLSIVKMSKPIGSWSIFNEMIFYLFTPAILVLYNRNVRIGNGITLVTVVIGFIFSFYMMNPQKRLIDQWGTYINPVNHFFFYTTGIWIYFNFHAKKISQTSNTLLLIITFSFLTFLPYSGNQIVIVEGVQRLLFFTLCTFLVFCFYKFNLLLPVIVQKPLELLGLTSYSIYILHNIVYKYVQLLFGGVAKEHRVILFFSVIVLTVPFSVLVYHFIEKPCIYLGKKLSPKKEPDIGVPGTVETVIPYSVSVTHPPHEGRSGETYDIT